MVLLPLTFLGQVVLSQDESTKATEEIVAYRKKQETEFKDPIKSPLVKKDLKKFKGLHYYPIDLKYRLKATFVKNETPVFFKMKTSASILKDYNTYGIVNFELDGVQYGLEVYQSPDVMKMPGYADYLFIPFTDVTNGKETYDGGRYLELRIPETNEVVLDFNQCYNPYCAYGSIGRYACPIPPAANALPIAILAGEKKFKEANH